MSKKMPVALGVALIVFACVITFLSTYVLLSYGKSGTSGSGTDAAFSGKAADKLAYVDELYRQYYVGEIDEDKLADGLVRGYIAGVGDKYASYMTKEEFTAYMQESSGEFVGIGVHVIYDSTNGLIEIISVTPDSPALAAGLCPGDLVIRIGEESVADLGYYPAIDKVLGEEGTDVTLTVRRQGADGPQEIEYTITRAKIADTTVDFRMYDEEIGVIRIYSFASNTDESVIRAITELQNLGAKKLLFDVRYNPGGELSGIVDTLDYLLPEGPIVHITDGNGNETRAYNSDAKELDMPMVVLVNGNTASAAELFTSALQDYDKATIVGTQTYGKGTVQSVITLPDGSGLALSASLYNPPFSENYEGVGITPDVVVEMSEDVKDMNVYTIPDAQDDQFLAGIRALNGAES